MINKSNNGSGTVTDSWFNEIDTMWKGLSLGVEVKKVLHEEKSKFQEILVFESESFGNVLALDGVIQLTDRDEYAYHEMLAHVPLYINKNPETILVIGGGDGGILREALKHETIKEVVLCEIDQSVINVSKKYFPEISSGFNNKKVKLFIGDGSEYLKNTDKKFDVVIVDSSDPVGPANTLFTQEFYESLSSILKSGGTVAVQGESLFLHKEFAINLKNITDDIFFYTGYSQVCVPTYPGGNIGLLICSNTSEVESPTREVPEEIQTNLKYYSNEIHKASFILPSIYKV